MEKVKLTSGTLCLHATWDLKSTGQLSVSPHWQNEAIFESQKEVQPDMQQNDKSGTTKD